MKSVGTQLREARTARGWTPQAAAKITKIKEQQLLHLEAEEYDQFPAPAYVRGFVRIYAKTLGLDEVEILRILDVALLGKTEEAAAPAYSAPLPYIDRDAERRFSQPRLIRRLTFAAVLLMAAAIVLILVIRIHQVLPVTVSTAHPVALLPTPKEAPALTPADSDEPVAKATPVAPLVAPNPGEEPVAKAVPIAPAAPVAVAAPTPSEPPPTPPKAP
jgi:cytoskeletal protein RodZ